MSLCELLGGNVLSPILTFEKGNSVSFFTRLAAALSHGLRRPGAIGFPACPKRDVVLRGQCGKG